MHLIAWLNCMMAVAISVSLAFTIDTTAPDVYTTEENDLFRNKVLQIITGKDRRILDTVSNHLNGSEETCQSDLKQTHRCIVIPDISLANSIIPVDHFGLSVAEDSIGSQFTICSPGVAHEPNENCNLRRVCYKMMDHSQQTSSFTTAFQEYTKMTVDLVFLFDGSGSMTEAEFNTNKHFIVDIMNSLRNTSIKFAAVQFSYDYNKVFDFNDYQAGRAFGKLTKERHMRSLTNTYKALEFVLEEIFDNPGAGASPNATKVLMLITDGNPSDEDDTQIIERYDDKNIIRFVIGVKNVRQEKLMAIASEPKDERVVTIEYYRELKKVLELFRQKIQNIGEAQVTRAGDVTHSGLGVVLYKVCSPDIAQKCDGNFYLNSVCYKMTDHPQQVSSTPAFQKYTKMTVDLVFLFDGSGSMTKAEFNTNKHFIVDIMNSLRNTSIKFAAVQFSYDYNKVFDFNDYQAGRAFDKLMKERQMKSLTNTYKALEFVLEEIFDNPGAGASPDATKVLLLITDGDPSDEDDTQIIERYDDKNIIRFVIGVRNVMLEKIEVIASEPKDKNVFKIENYNGLTGLLEMFQTKISKVEGDVTNKMSQRGFSAVFSKVCSPDIAQKCDGNFYLNSVCYKMTDHPQQVSSTPAFQKYTKMTVDLVFLFDGSGSMTKAEFNTNKHFIVDIMNSLRNTSIKFAAVQFSYDYNKVFDFNDYQAGRAFDKLMKERHMKSLTNTYKALEFVLEEIFDNPGAGASPDATKVLLLITDGDPSDEDDTQIIERYDDKNIIRFVIGVRNVMLEKIEVIASEPKDKNVFKIENYNGLTGLLEMFQTKISKVEGDVTNKMSQRGFSAVFSKVCSPDIAQKCDGNFYLNSVCYKMTDHPQQVSSTPAFQKYTKMTVDLVFLFDGSGSMTEAEFNTNKHFIVDIMNSLRNTSIKFAAVQFSYDYNKVFDFNDYQAGRAFDKLMKERQMKSLTNTYKALEFVLEEIFDNPGAGASPDATKVLLLITDGDPSDEDDTQIIERYDDKNIIRFVIGVRNVMLEKIKVIASEPKDKNVFKIENYNGLTGLLEMFQTKISKVEGDVTNKMSQRGFSAVFSKENLILGSVGSNSWRSLLQDCHEDSHMQKSSYRGYSTSVGKNNNAALYFTGAPRFEHTGRVVLFRHDDKNWTAAQTINGEQIGSYFGAELCSVDIDSDGNTDFLLVGAPLFYQPQEKSEGRIYIYKLTDEMRLERGLDVSAPSMGRFGTAISSLTDLNRDGLRDVAVGAPMEDDNTGAVYIFLGDRHSGIRSTFSQRISGQQIKPELRFFGQAIDGDIHLGENVPPNIIVGSQGVAVVLRSRPVFNVTAHLFSQPAEISTDIVNCRGNTDESLPVITLRGCFEMVETTKSKAGTTNSGLQISYVLDVDPLRETNRGFFNQTDKKARNVTSTYELRDKHTCFSHPVYMPTCVDDTVSPISIRFKFFQVDSESASAVLDLDSETQAVVEVPFQK